MQVVRIDTEAEVHIATTSFLLRIMNDEHGLMEHCSIRHTASGREAYMRGSPGLGDLIKECLLVADPSPSSTSANRTERTEKG